ncbi:hypothetical protein FE257_005460 [Aspergillus nanangensis]|uniref:Pentatricopeptide repeat domain-containing protein n=1 Tax=Aspergillus nanangensis TaxID=2582783 RepID=A0AAD4CQK2_ASPNN|nr:hypothetical protein FE257_005460 [Aspergillus nanangensis]
MRPALLRLLKRPSALSVLDSLISVPVGIDQLAPRYRSKCLRCHSQGVQQAKCVQGTVSEQPVNKHAPTRSTRRPLSFHIHGIESPSMQTQNGTARVNAPNPNHESSDTLQSLSLQPDKLEFESDLGHTSDIGTRLVDSPAHRHDFALWEELLRYRQRHYGDKGTLDIWEGMMVRVDDIELPVSGKRANFFWQSFVDLGLKREAVMRELVDYSFQLWERSGKRWDKLYESVLTGFLQRGMTQRAVEWHKKLQHPHISSPNDILRVFDAALTIHHQSTTNAVTKTQWHTVSPGLSAFQHICCSTAGHQIYGPVISTLLSSDCIDETFPMHTFLVGRGDHPETYDDFRPLLDYADRCGRPHLSQKLHTYASQRFPDGKSETCEPLPQTQTSLQSKNEEWPQEKSFKDEFGARLFATKALNFDMILSGLRMFGVPAIGPHSLREMATRAHGCQDILEKLNQLEDAKISVGDSVFARLLRKLATENRSILLSDLLHSDQHPDMLEDANVQESLLVSYYITHDWRLYNMTLAILGEICKDEPDLHNIRFRQFLVTNEWDLASKTVDDMILRGKTLTGQSIDYMVGQVLAPRRLGVGPVQRSSMTPVQEVKFVLRILQRVVPMGSSVPSALWTEMLKRLGMTGSWNELRTCCRWLVQHYSSDSNSKRANALKFSKKVKSQGEMVSRQHDHHLVQTIFDRHMQAAIVSWGFRMRVSAKPRNDLIPWVRGLSLLRELEQSGVHLWTSWIRRACRHRLAVLYGRPRQSSRLMNRLLRQENPYSLERVMDDINCAWGEPMFGSRKPEDMQQLVNPPSSGMSQRRTQRMIFRETHLRRGAFIRTR